MANIPPVPTWADIKDPAWLNWFLTVSKDLNGVGATIAAGFTQALNGSDKNCGTPGGSIAAGNYYDTLLTIKLTQKKRVLYWAEIGSFVNSTTSYGGLYRAAIYRDGTAVRKGVAVQTDFTRINSSVLLLAEDLLAGTYNIQLGAEVVTGWSVSSGYPLVINPRVLLLYAPS